MDDGARHAQPPCGPRVPNLIGAHRAAAARRAAGCWAAATPQRHPSGCWWHPGHRAAHDHPRPTGDAERRRDHRARRPDQRPAGVAIAAEANLVPVVLDGRGAVLHLGRTRRTASPAQRLALAARDGGCSFPGCDRPPEWCETHHAIPWADGGLRIWRISPSRADSTTASTPNAAGPFA